MEQQITETIFKGADNAISFTVYQDEQPLDMTAVTRMVLDVEGEVFDSSVNSEFITWDQNGLVTVKVGAVIQATGFKQAILTAYDPQHTNGQVITHTDQYPVLNRDIR